MPFLTEAVSRKGGRELNEDSYGFLEMNQSACWIVADGLGGHRGGETASKVAVEAALASFRAEPDFSAPAVQKHLEAAQQAILAAQKDAPTLSTMRTTIVILLANSQRALWAHVGDSRLYCLEDGHIVFCTKDHSVVQAMVNAGELPASRIRHHEDRNRLLRCLGNAETDFRPTILAEPRALRAGTAFVLCTDGFWENVTEPEMEVDFAKGGGTKEWLACMEGRLLERANENSDNYTAIAIRFEPENDRVAAGGTVNSSQNAKISDRPQWALAGLLTILLLAAVFLLATAWTKQHSLENQILQLTNDKADLTKQLNGKQTEMENVQQALNDARKQPADCAGRTKTNASPSPHAGAGH